MTARSRLMRVLLAVVTAVALVPGVAGRANAEEVILAFTSPTAVEGESIDVIAGTAPIDSQLHVQVVLNGDWSAPWVDVPVDATGSWSLQLAAPTPKPSLLQVTARIGDLANPARRRTSGIEACPTRPRSARSRSLTPPPARPSAEPSWSAVPSTRSI